MRSSAARALRLRAALAAAIACSCCPAHARSAISAAHLQWAPLAATTERLDQLVDAYRLGEVIVHAGRDAHLAVALHRVGRHRDDARALAGAARADRARGLETVHFGHLHVHQDDIVVWRSTDSTASRPFEARSAR